MGIGGAEIEQNYCSLICGFQYQKVGNVFPLGYQGYLYCPLAT